MLDRNPLFGRMLAWSVVGCALILLRTQGADLENLPADPTAAGKELAAALRSQSPNEGATNSASLRIRDKSGRRRTVPITIETHVAANGWRARYVAGETSSNVVEATISHTLGAAPQYAIRQQGQPASDLRTAATGSADLALAGSDFWVSDLALEFLHWPEQRVLRQELSSGRMCHVLESVNPSTNGYARVHSWIDTKYLALLNAQAFDSSRRLVKSFSTGSFRRITRPDGREAWFLQDVKMSDRRRDTVTELSFELPAEAK